MSNTSITMSEFVKKFKEATTDEERAVAILDLVQQSQNQTKEKTLKVIDELKTDLAETKSSLIKWIISGIALLGIWTALIAALLVKHIA